MTTSELLILLKQWENVSLGDLALSLNGFMHSKMHKGDTGRLIEMLLGGQNSNSRAPDLEDLWLEIKTLPLQRNLKIIENTFLSSIPLPFCDGSLENSRLWYKISKILFVTILRAGKSPSYHDRIGKSFILDWNHDSIALNALKKDWNLLSSILLLEEYHLLDSTLGEILHVRPKARDAAHKVLVGRLKINPLGFYLRKTFLQPYVDRAFH